MVQKSLREVEAGRKHKSTDAAKTARRVLKIRRLADESVDARRAYARHDRDEGPTDIYDDLSPDELQEMKTAFYSAKVVVTAEKAHALDVQQPPSQGVTCGRKKEEND